MLDHNTICPLLLPERAAEADCGCSRGRLLPLPLLVALLSG
jgi:hypothetical protein